jgi:N-acetylmuramoyl-L-alanine amidase
MKLDIELVSTVAKRIKVAQFDDSTVRVVVETMADVNIFWLNGGPAGKRLVIDIGNAAFKPNDELNKQQQKKDAEEDAKTSKKLDKPNINQKPETKTSTETKSNENTKKSDTNKDIKLGEEVDAPFSHKKDTKKDEKKTDTKTDKKSDKKDKDKKIDKKDKKSDKKDKKSKNKKGEVEEPFQELEEELDNILTLEGKIIVIDPGHGGGDAGAIGPTGVMEKSVTLRVALALEKMLQETGAEVIMTRRTDRQVSAKGDRASAIEELQARCDVANNANATIFISIHADSFTNPAARGSTGYYYSKTEGTSAKRLADAIRRGICEQLRTPSRGTKPCDFYVVRHTDMAATLVELAFISNPDEEKLLDSDEGILKAAQGIFDGIEDYFG